MQTIPFPQYGCAVHGGAFTMPEEPADHVLAGFTAPDDGLVHIGLLHGELTGSERDVYKRQEQLAEWSMKAAELGDSITWGAMWNACKLEVQDRQHLTGDALLNAAALRFREVIYRSQVVDGTLTRSHTMRDRSTFKSLATAFMAERCV